MALVTQFITLEISLVDAEGDLVAWIEAALAEQGHPLRWAITHIDPVPGMATVEAVITVPS